MKGGCLRLLGFGANHKGGLAWVVGGEGLQVVPPGAAHRACCRVLFHLLQLVAPDLKLQPTGCVPFCTVMVSLNHHHPDPGKRFSGVECLGQDELWAAPCLAAFFFFFSKWYFFFKLFESSIHLYNVLIFYSYLPLPPSSSP